MERCRKENKKGQKWKVQEREREREPGRQPASSPTRWREVRARDTSLETMCVCARMCVYVHARVCVCERQQCEIKGGAEMNTEEETEEECSGAQQQRG